MDNISGTLPFDLHKEDEELISRAELAFSEAALQIGTRRVEREPVKVIGDPYAQFVRGLPE